MDYIGGEPSQNYELPEIITFYRIGRFHEELPEYLKSFEHTEYEPQSIFDNFGTPVNIVRDWLKDETYKYLIYNYILLKYPWSIILPSARDFVFNYYTKKLDGPLINKILPDITEWSSLNYSQAVISNNYPIIYTKSVTFKIKFINGSIILVVRYVLGKRKDGKFDVLMIDFQNNKNIHIFNILKTKGITDFSLIISDREPMSIYSLNVRIANHYPNTKVVPCITTFVDRLSRTDTVLNEDIPNINNILSQGSIADAYNMCNSLVKSKTGNYLLYKKLKIHLHNLINLFNYSPNTRAIIGTTNLISYIGFHTQFLLDNASFINEAAVLNYLNIVTRKILDNGKKLIPAWDKFIQPVEIK
jgi:hypothetical protein